MSSDDRRRSPRVLLNVRVSGDLEHRPIAMGACRDISRNGMFVSIVLGRPDEEVKANDKVRLEFRPPNAPHPIEVRGRVVRTERDPEGGQAGFGVEFLHVEPDHQALIEEYIVANLLEHS